MFVCVRNMWMSTKIPGSGVSQLNRKSGIGRLVGGFGGSGTFATSNRITVGMGSKLFACPRIHRRDESIVENAFSMKNAGFCNYL